MHLTIVPQGSRGNRHILPNASVMIHRGWLSFVSLFLASTPDDNVAVVLSRTVGWCRRASIRHFDPCQRDPPYPYPSHGNLSGLKSPLVRVGASRLSRQERLIGTLCSTRRIERRRDKAVRERSRPRSLFHTYVLPTQPSTISHRVYRARLFPFPPRNRNVSQTQFADETW
jgi:hypothetical protein